VCAGTGKKGTLKKTSWCLVVIAILTTSCATPEADEEAPAQGAETRRVQIDATPADFAGAAILYFPDQVTVRPGDTVNFKQVFTGEPHSVTMGTLIDEVIPEARRLGGQEPPPDLLDKFESLPVMLPEGPGDANQVAINPCFVESGPLPAYASQPCPNKGQPAFNGRQSYYSSGYLPPDEDFNVQLSDDINRGNYSYYCNLHGPLMSGIIKVVGKRERIPSQSQVERQARQQIDRAYAPARKAFEEARSGRAPFANLAGYGSQESPLASILEFIPKPTRARVGQKATWVFFGPHTISFNPTSAASPFIKKAPDGTYHINEATAAPAGGPGQPLLGGGGGPQATGSPNASPTGSPRATPTGSPTTTPAGSRTATPTGSPTTTPTASPGTGVPSGLPRPTEINGSRFSGSGFRSSGLVLSFPPEELFSYSLTFTRPGTFNYVCLIHPAMTGSIEVT
jgi:plastocyanin